MQIIGLITRKIGQSDKWLAIRYRSYNIVEWTNDWRIHSKHSDMATWISKHKTVHAAIKAVDEFLDSGVRTGNM